MGVDRALKVCYNTIERGKDMTDKERRAEVAGTIVAQMGGFNKLEAAVGASNWTALENGLQFSFKGSRKANKCVVKLNGLDYYDVEFWKVNLRAKDPCKLVSETAAPGLCFDQLIEYFEGQTGLYLRIV